MTILQAAGRHAALYETVTRLPRACQRLIAVPIENSPMSSAQISARLGISAGSIGTSPRCLDKLRRDPAIAALTNAEAASSGGDTDRAGNRAASATAQARSSARPADGP